MRNKYSIPTTQYIVHEKPTYRFRVADFTPVATATDVLELIGAANIVARVTKIEVIGSATASALLDVYLTKRTALNTAGTKASQAAVITKARSDDPTAACTLNLYSANATSLGTGTALEGTHMYMPAAATPAFNDRVIWTWGSREDTPSTLLSATELLTINLGGAAIPAGTSLYLSIEWTEDIN